MKRAWRHALRRGRRPLPAARRRAAGARVCARVAALPEFQAARRIGCYLARADELPLDDLIALCRARGIAVAVPAGRPRSAAYAWADLAEDEALTPGRWGILEPRAPRWTGRRRLDLILAPALAFDPRGARLGRGGGHFDRLLRGRRGLRIGVALERQVRAGVPAGPADVPMHRLVTERRLIVCDTQQPKPNPTPGAACVRERRQSWK